MENKLEVRTHVRCKGMVLCTSTEADEDLQVWQNIVSFLSGQYSFIDFSDNFLGQCHLNHLIPFLWIFSWPLYPYSVYFGYHEKYLGHPALLNIFRISKGIPNVFDLIHHYLDNFGIIIKFRIDTWYFII